MLLPFSLKNTPSLPSILLLGLIPYPNKLVHEVQEREPKKGITLIQNERAKQERIKPSIKNEGEGWEREREREQGGSEKGLKNL